MAGVVEKLTLAREGLLEPGQHVIEGQGDLRRLVRAGRRDALTQVGVGDPSRRVGEQAQRAKHPTRQRQAEQGRDRDGAQLDEHLRRDRRVDLATLKGREVGNDEQPVLSAPAHRDGDVTCLAERRVCGAALRIFERQPVADRTLHPCGVARPWGLA